MQEIKTVDEYPLIDAIRAWYEDKLYPPSGGNLGPNVEEVHFDYLSSERWGMTFIKVYRQGNVYVAVEDVEPATEMQDWGDYGDPEIYEVEPYEVITTKYRKKS